MPYVRLELKMCEQYLLSIYGTGASSAVQDFFLLAIKGLYSRSVLEFWVLGIGYWKKTGTVGVFD